ncbi:MAG: hypothetical protein CMI79_06680 [Candidatus Pelagibacter sp.]|nr:hypothetical protein [Candidatus Pelagibacter sp.]|tara:strand:+ start:8773 stop:9117 length:345 start_codon:yes stop_codon:yes gene_type:complete
MIKELLEYAKNYGDKKWHQDTFQFLSYAFYIITIITFTGVMAIDPSYIDILEAVIQLYVAGFLIIKFNPLVKHNKELSAFDRQIAYAAGVFLFFTSVLGVSLKAWTFYKVKTFI